MVDFTGGTWRSLIDGSEISAIPDVGVWDSPIYQWTAQAGIGVNDGDEASNWEDQLARITATAVGSPTYRENQSGFEAVEYGSDGGEDGHNWSSNNSLPTGDDARSVVCLVYHPSISGTQTSTGFGDMSGDGTEFYLRPVDSGGSPKAQLRGSDFDFKANTTLTADEWQTVGLRYDGSGEATIFVNGNNDASNTFSQLSTPDANHSIGYERDGPNNYYDGFIAEILWSDIAETDQAFSDYHNDRLG